jgi:AraC family transcriptional regulator, regulatory protein of adaptative response / methylated-DNA-[protein]-cysteine methyltransferase
MNAVAAEPIVRTTPMPASQPFSTDAEKWEAVRHRDPAADGHFFFAVKTTGVYCRPSCAARPARPENVAFYATRAAAERAGFRPCKRCRPDAPPRSEREAALVAAACRTIESAEEPPRLSQLAALAGGSPYHFHRTFKRIVGVTPKAYAAAHRNRRVQSSLQSGSEVTAAIYDAGFNSSGRFYEVAPEILGMKPSVYRNGGQGEAVWHSVGRCSLGRVLVAATARGLCAILLGDSAAELQADLKTRFPHATLTKPPAGFADWIDTVVRFVDDPARAGGLDLPLDVRGTAFQRRVWEALRHIPAGKTTTYTEIAGRMGSPRAARAVAGACAANALAVAIPCHRVIASNGALAGYRWGVERKRRLLEREHK